MIFFLNVLAVIGFSLFTGPSNQTEGLELLLKNETFQNIIFAGDITGAEEFLYQFALGQIARNSNLNRNNLNVEKLHLSISLLRPKIAALALIDKLLPIATPLEKRKTSQEFLDKGFLRKMGVRGADAPRLTEISLHWAQGEVKKGDSLLLKEERTNLLKKSEAQLHSAIMAACQGD